MSPARRPRTVRPVGDLALLVQCADLPEVLALHAALTEHPLPGQREVLPAARTVLVRATSTRTRAALAQHLARLPTPPRPEVAGALVTIDTVYDGEDLSTVAHLTGLSVDGVVAAHTGPEWTAAFGGFAPGFTYLLGENEDLQVPRRDTPRTSVPAGSVALAGTFSAVYPRRSPGGWQLIGRTATPMWDLTRQPPALVRPGDRVRFRAVRELVELGAPVPDVGARSPGVGSTADTAPAPPDPATSGTLTVLDPGLQSLVEDLGRPGLGDLGVSPSGALDRGAALRANRLVGNDRSAAVIETVLGGLELRADGEQVLAVCGAPASLTVLTGGGQAGSWHPPAEGPFALRDGEVLRLGAPAAGLRAYVAVRGGVAVPPALGSRSTDVLSGIGPDPLTSGTVLPVAAPPLRAVAHPESPRPPQVGAMRVGVVVGPRSDWVTTDSLDRFLAQEWTVTDRSNRVGLRLDGTPLTRAVTDELPSEGTVAGAVQLPADGRPVVFLADHPVTGGYPVIAVVRDADRDALAQVRPGDRLRFVADSEE